MNDMSAPELKTAAWSAVGVSKAHESARLHVRGQAQAAFEAAPHTVKGELYVGGQEQFYLEGQIAYAIPQENDGMLVLCSTQHPSEMQHVVAHALGLHSHHVVVECRRMGGGFGGKESQSALWAAAAAVSARLCGRPVKLRADRDDDMLVTAKRNVTPYGQVVVDNVIHELVDELEASSEYRARRTAIEAFNRGSPVLKKGLALTPVKFGIAFNVTHLNQAGALVHVYVDGSILVNHGGTEMGQGVNTKVMQVVAHELGVDLARVRISATNTGKVANTSDQ